MQVYCDNIKCDYNDDKTCTRAEMYCVGRTCKSYHKSSVRETMRNINSRCKHEDGKYKSKDIRLIK